MIESGFITPIQRMETIGELKKIKVWNKKAAACSPIFSIMRFMM